MAKITTMKRYRLVLVNQETIEQRKNSAPARREFMEEFESRFVTKHSTAIMLKDEEVTYILVRFGHIFNLESME